MRGSENLTIPMVEEEFHVSRPTVARWISKGCRGRVLPSVLVGGRRLIRRQDLEQWIIHDHGSETKNDLAADPVVTAGNGVCGQ
jgi:excisionase family DNA binding protein